MKMKRTLFILCVFIYNISDSLGLNPNHDGIYITTLVSPNHPGNYPSSTQMEWKVVTEPHQMVLIDLKILEIEQIWDTVSIHHVASIGNTATNLSLAGSSVTSVLLPGGSTVVTFCSDAMEQQLGFAMVFTTYDITTNETTIADIIGDVFYCHSGLEHIRVSARCDGIVDCHDFSDEIGCDECSPGAFRCNGSDICLLPSLQCDGRSDCPHGEDEMFCDTLRCPSTCSCGEYPYVGYASATKPPCRDPDWLPFWVNCTEGWNEDYINGTAPKAFVINLDGAPIRYLEKGAFMGLSNVNTLDLSSAQLTHLPPGVFIGLSRLWKLTLRNNSLTALERGTFEGLRNLGRLSLEVNHIFRLDEGCFMGLDSIFFIDFEYNDLTVIPPGAFSDMGESLERLIITHNRLTSLNASIFYGLNKLDITSFQGNPITTIEPGALNGLPTLRDVRLLSSDRIRLQPDTFVGPSEIELLVVRDQRVCCIAPESFGCITRELPHPLFTCRRTFLQNSALKVFIWILGISALLGNGFVIFTRLRDKTSTSIAAVQSTLITNLAVSDFLMGIYMLIIAVMDLYVGESYFWDGVGNEWRSSNACQVAGFISFLSSEASVFLITLISVDRFIVIMFPFSQKRLGVKSSRVFVAIMWLLALVLSVVSLLLNQLDPDAYGLSDVCVGLPLIRKFSSVYSEVDTYTLARYGVYTLNFLATGTSSTWQFSIAIYLGVNLVSFLVIFFCYVAIFYSVRLSRAAAGKKEKSASEIKMALKMFLIVGTDFFCWMPIIIMGILVQSDVITLSSDVYAWLVVFVLPINSSINPFLYTLIEKATK